jgi:predicted HAD superfamily phosphohydrolase YqeG
MGLELKQVAVIGDQPLTDILAAERLGVQAILVDRLANREFLITKFSTSSKTSSPDTGTDGRDPIGVCL